MASGCGSGHEITTAKQTQSWSQMCNKEHRFHRSFGYTPARNGVGGDAA
jgi:hypothetical protein